MIVGKGKHYVLCGYYDYEGYDVPLGIFTSLNEVKKYTHPNGRLRTNLKSYSSIQVFGYEENDPESDVSFHFDKKEKKYVKDGCQ